MTVPLRRLLLALAVVTCAPAADVDADWLFTGFAGGTFKGSTALLDPERGAEATHFVFGGAAGWLSDGIFGVEGEVATAPKFFERGARTTNLVVDSNVTTASGAIIVAMPLSVSQYSLRPYVIGGLALIHAGVQDLVNFAPQVNDGETMGGVTVGVGALGFLTPDAGVRFDLRHLRSLSREDDIVTLERKSTLAFWRLTIGAVIRY